MVPENIQKLFIGDLAWVVDHFHGFHMAGTSGRYLLIGGVFHMAAGIAGYGIDDAVDLFEIRFGAPETASGKDRRTGLLGLNIFLGRHLILHAVGLLAAKNHCRQGNQGKICNLHVAPPLNT